MEKEILHLQQLSPRGNINTDGYTEAIDYALKNMEIRNVALSGTYGSGKSSIMRSYENMHKEKKCIHISLAHFEEQEGRNIAPQGDPDEKGKSKGNKTNHQNLINMLEGKIFNQLLHQVSPSAIPKARFQRKEDTSLRSRIFNAVCIVLFILICVFLPNYREWNALVAGLNESPFKRILNITTSPIMPVAGCILLIGLIALGVYYIIQTQSLSRVFKKIDFKGIFGVELFTSENDSIFDRYLNDVIYLFDNSGAEIIVFEDLDRYEVTKIFEELREINDLIARRRQQRGDSKILRFFYLIRDDVFTSSDRSKFFDLIIPVVPVIDTSNTYDMFIEQFEKAGIEDQFNKRLLQDVSLYLSDMRLVTNIINEYLIYKTKLSKNGLPKRANNRLAMLIYKNLYPHDFDSLLQGKGYVAALFGEKDKLSKALRIKLQTEISILEGKINAADKEPLQTLDELNAIFFPLNEHVMSIGEEVIPATIAHVDLVKKILENPDSTNAFNTNGRYPTTYRLDVAKLEEEMNKNPVYQQRKENIELKKGVVRNILEDKLAQMRIEEQQLSTYSLKKIIGQFDIGSAEEIQFWNPEMPPYEDDEYIDEIKKSHGYKLLQYLIREGYINENYDSDISNFYPNSLTPTDKNFLLSLSERTPLGPEYKLQRPQTVLERLDDSHFTLKECWNFSLLEYLFEENKTKELKTWFSTLDGMVSDSSASKFLLDYWKIAKDKKSFVTYVSFEFPTWFRRWSMEDILSGEAWYTYCFIVIQTVPPLTLEMINDDDWLTEQISNDSGFLSAYSGDVDLLIKGLETLKVQFQRIDIAKSSAFFRLLCVVYKHNLYALNPEMIELFMHLYWKSDKEDIRQKSYTMLSMKKEKPLYKRISQNMDEYMAAILGNESNQFCDEEQFVLELLNNDDITFEHKEMYIDRLNTKIEYLSEVDSHDLWMQILKTNVARFNEENILDYYAEKCSGADPLPEELVSFLSINRENLIWSQNTIDERLKLYDKSGYDFLLTLIKSISLPMDRYRTLLSSIKYNYSAFPLDDLPKDRVRTLIELRILDITKANTELIRKSYPSLLLEYSHVNSKRFVELVENKDISAITEEELSKLLKDSKLDLKFKIRLINTYDEFISLSDGDYSDDVAAYIINTKFDPNEIPDFLKHYDSYSKVVKEAFNQYAIDNTATIYNVAMRIGIMPLELYSVLQKELNPADAKALIEYLPNKNFAKACKKGHRPAFDNTEVNRVILEYFRESGWISSYKIMMDGKLRAFSREK